MMNKKVMCKSNNGSQFINIKKRIKICLQKINKFDKHIRGKKYIILKINNKECSQQAP